MSRSRSVDYQRTTGSVGNGENVRVSALVKKDAILHITDVRYASLGIDASLMVERLQYFNTRYVGLL